MNDRGMKKWQPFNAVVPREYLIKRDEVVSKPNLSKDEIAAFEELLMNSYYTHSSVNITYLENNQVKTITDIVIKLDSIKKNVYLKTKTINFRQIYKVT